MEVPNIMLSAPENKKNTIGDLSARTIILLLAWFLLVGSAIVWNNDAMVNTPGPNILKPRPDGNVYLQMDTDLYVLSPRGEVLGKHDLTRMGVGILMDFFVLDNDSILVRLGPDERNLISNIRSFMRFPNTDEVRTAASNTGLFTCVLATGQCQRFSGYDPDDVHWLALDKAAGRLYVADSTRHQIHLLDSNGKLLATSTEDYIFPNQITPDGDTLWLVDTNHRSIKHLTATEEGFGNLIKEVKPATEKITQEGYRVPYMMLTVGDERWVMYMRSNMDRGGVFRFDADWKLTGKLDIPEQADAGYLARVGDEVWVSDYETINLYRYDLTGKALGKVESSGLEAVFAANRKARGEYDLMMQAAIGVFVLSLLAGVIAGIWFEWRRGKAIADKAGETVTVNLNDPEIYWLKRGKAVKKTVIAMAAMILLGVGLMGLMFLMATAATTKETPFMSTFGVLLIPFLIFPLLLFVILRQRIGILGDVVILRNGKKHRAARGENVIFSGNHIAIDDLFLSLGTDAIRFYHTEDIVKRLNPLLVNAAVLERRDMGAYQFYAIFKRLSRFWRR